MKVYRLSPDEKWDDQGTGHVTIDYLEVKCLDFINDSVHNLTVAGNLFDSFEVLFCSSLVPSNRCLLFFMLGFEKERTAEDPKF